MKISNCLSRLRWDRFFSALILGVVILSAISPAAMGQFKFREPPNRQNPAALSERDGEVVWEQFLSNRDMGAFALEGKLVHRPANAASQSFSLLLNGDWSAEGEKTSIVLDDGGDRHLEQSILIRDGQAFRQKDESDCAGLLPLSDEEASGPLFENLPFTWQDLLMPYLGWKDVSYVGPARYLGRPAHRFALVNENPDGSLLKVIVTLDEDYAALLKADLYGTDDKLLKRIRIGGFKQFESEWMFSELFWEDRVTRESVILKVSAFLLNQ